MELVLFSTKAIFLTNIQFSKVVILLRVVLAYSMYTPPPVDAVLLTNALSLMLTVTLVVL